MRRCAGRATQTEQEWEEEGDWDRNEQRYVNVIIRSGPELHSMVPYAN
jgi:hypothetical protein